MKDKNKYIGINPNLKNAKLLKNQDLQHDGTALVEAAIVLPLLAFVLMVVVELAWAIFNYMSFYAMAQAGSVELSRMSKIKETCPHATYTNFHKQGAPGDASEFSHWEAQTRLWNMWLSVYSKYLSVYHNEGGSLVDGPEIGSFSIADTPGIINACSKNNETHVAGVFVRGKARALAFPFTYPLHTESRLGIRTFDMSPSNPPSPNENSMASGINIMCGKTSKGCKHQVYQEGEEIFNQTPPTPTPPPSV
ncbi:pilus assembly protein [Oligoflexia bacterium]|nr:pilus assembly protein [Oligoflexia bacterium]